MDYHIDLLGEPLHRECLVRLEDPFLRMAYYDQLESLSEALIRNEIKIDHIDPDFYSKGDGLLHAAVFGRATRVLSYLRRFGLSANKQNKLGYSPYHLAILSDDPYLMTTMIDWPYLNINELTGAKWPPLYLAIKKQKLISVNSLLNTNIDKSLVGPDNKTPFKMGQDENLLPYELSSQF